MIAALAGACANDKNEQQQELQQMRTEIEQLTNALGRLEFRVYELENQQGSESSVDDQAADVTSENARGTGTISGTETAPESIGKRFDLAPVE
jgi:predicted  nucleic acid-binding Zn-ribbon protein